MKRNLLTLALTIWTMSAFCQIVITEISYNPPESGTDSLEYIEIYNVSNAPVALTDWSFTKGVDYTFDELTMMPGDYYLLAVNANAMQSFFGVTAGQWMGALTNSGEAIELSDAAGAVVDFVDLKDSGDWPSSATGTDGNGASIELCDPTSDNNVGSNWRAATNNTGVFAGPLEYLGTPGAANTVVCGTITYPPTAIGVATAVDADGNLVTPGASVAIEGVVYGVNQNAAGLQFTIIDDTNEGIGLYSSAETFGYTVTEGDLIKVEGTVGQFNGLAQISPVSLELISTDNALIVPTTITALGETTESSLVKFESATIVDVAMWTGTGSGFNVEVSNGNETIEIRIDNDVELYAMSAPNGVNNYTGIGGQFDNSAPYTAGYQLLPRYAADIETVLSVSDLAEQNRDLRLAPNPATTSILWSLPQEVSNIKTVQIFNLAGNLLSTTTDRLVDVAALTPGMYLLKVNTGSALYTQRFVKQ